MLLKALTSELTRGYLNYLPLRISRALSSASENIDKGVPYKTLEGLRDEKSSTDFVSTADVVLIGGGAAGCAALYNLAKLGITNVVLLEKDQLTSGTTWHTAGLMWQLRPNDIDIELLRQGRDMIFEIEKETGVSTGWIQNGGLFIANNEERLNEYKRLHTIGNVYGIQSHVLSPTETKELYPLININDIYGTLYTPEDATVDPAGYCTALTRVARKLGAKVFTNCSVGDVVTKVDDFGTRRVHAVETSLGVIQTKNVINCTGVWARDLSRRAQIKCPLLPMKHAYIVTERIEGIQNMPNVRDHDASVYLKLQGDTLQVGGYEQDPIILNEMPSDFSFSLYELDWDVFSAHINGAVNRIPVIEQTGIRSTVCGPGGGCGRQLAHWIKHGRPEIDMFAFDIRRFNEKLTDNSEWIKQRSHEAYAKNYSIVFPFDEPLASRKMRKTPLYDVLADAGCVYQERHGWERVGWFTENSEPAAPLDYDWYGYYGHTAHATNPYYDRLKQEYTFGFPTHHDVIGAECLTCRNSAAVFDMSYFGKFYLCGPDAKQAADWIFSNDMRKGPGSTVYTCMLNSQGKVEADLTVTLLGPIGEMGSVVNPSFEGPNFYIAAGGAAAQHAWSHIRTAIQDKGFHCQLIDRSDQMGMISVQGPNSRDILQPLVNRDLSNESFPFSTHQLIRIAGKEARALRLSFVGELGWEIHAANDVCGTIYKAIMESGKKYGIRNAGYRAIDALSLEKGYRLWHADIRSDDSPLEAGLAFTCKLKHDVDFQGREAILKQKGEGPLKRRLCMFTLDKHIPLFGLEGIYRNGQPVGYLRRGDFGFTINKSIGVGYVNNDSGVTPEYLSNGQFEIECLGVKYPATYHKRSPFDPSGNRVKGIYTSTST